MNELTTMVDDIRKEMDLLDRKADELYATKGDCEELARIENKITRLRKEKQGLWLQLRNER